MITAAGFFLHALAWSFAVRGGVHVGRWDKTKVRSDLRTGLITMVIAALLQSPRCSSRRAAPVAAIVVLP